MSSGYEDGRRIEWAVMHHLTDNGYAMTRAASSKGVADCIGIKDGQVLLINVKRTTPPGPTERADLLRVAAHIPDVSVPLVALGPASRLTYRRLTGPGPAQWVAWVPDEIEGEDRMKEHEDWCEVVEHADCCAGVECACHQHPAPAPLGGPVAAQTARGHSGTAEGLGGAERPCGICLQPGHDAAHCIPAMRADLSMGWDDLKYERDRARQGLWDVYAALGFDTDGDPTPRHLVYPDLVTLVLDAAREYRKQSDEDYDADTTRLEGERDRARDVAAHLEAELARVTEEVRALADGWEGPTGHDCADDLRALLTPREEA